MNQVTGVMGVSRHERALAAAVEQLHRNGFRDVETFSPIPCDVLSEDQETHKSPIHFYTLAGGALGAVTGLGFPSWTVLNWPLITGGKPIISIPAFLVIAFELTILFGGLFTLAGLVIHGPLGRTAPAPAARGPYDSRFGVDRFGVFVPCEPAKFDEVRRILLEADAEETSVVGE